MRTLLTRALIVACFLALPTIGRAQTTSTSTSSSSTSTSTSSTSTSTSTSTTTSTLTTGATWVVIQNANCTADVAATGVTTGLVNCCQGSGAGVCEYRDTSGGTQFVRHVTLATGAQQGYTSGGDLINAGNLSKINIDNILSFRCGPTTAGHGVRINFTTASGKRAPKVRLFSGTTEVTSANIGGLVTDCIVVGH